MTIAIKQIKDGLVQLGKSQAWLARYLDVTEGAVSRWLCGTCLPDSETRRKLDELFGIADPWNMESENICRNDDISLDIKIES